MPDRPLQAFGEVFNLFHRPGQAAAGQFRERFANPQVFGRNGEQPGFGHVAKDIPGQGQQGCRVRSVGHDLRAGGGGQFSELHLPGSIDRGINEDDRPRLSERVRQLRGQERARERANARKAERRDGLSGFWADGIVAAQGVAVTDDQQFHWTRSFDWRAHGVDYRGFRAGRQPSTSRKASGRGAIHFPGLAGAEFLL